MCAKHRLLPEAGSGSLTVCACTKYPPPELLSLVDTEKLSVCENAVYTFKKIIKTNVRKIVILKLSTYSSMHFLAMQSNFAGPDLGPIKRVIRIRTMQYADSGLERF